jgi:hypothetical protein
LTRIKLTFVCVAFLIVGGGVGVELANMHDSAYDSSSSGLQAISSKLCATSNSSPVLTYNPVWNLSKKSVTQFGLLFNSGQTLLLEPGKQETVPINLTGFPHATELFLVLNLSNPEPSPPYYSPRVSVVGCSFGAWTDSTGSIYFFSASSTLILPIYQYSVMNLTITNGWRYSGYGVPNANLTATLYYGTNLDWGQLTSTAG